MTAPASGALPEIGPLLGRLAGWSEEGVLADGILGPIRLGLVDAILERAGVARRHLAAGNITSARSAIGRPAWLSEWERAVAAASAAVAEEAERRLRHAAIAARYPAKRLASLLPDVEEKRVLSARLSAVGVPLEEGTADLGEAPSEWIGAITRMAGELESAWDGLHRAARQELQMWERRADEIRGWRRPWRTLGLIGGLSLSLAVWAGLVLGGFLPVPNFLRPAAEWLWSLPWP